MDTYEIILKVIIICVFSGFIGFEREYNYRPAGFRTHTLVGVAATLISIIQLYIADHNLQLALANPEIANIFIYEQSRLVAQIISGIGFLGAGTIIVTKKNVVGLTTAASLWATASLGIAVGFGHYKLALIAFIAIYLILILFKRVTYIHKITHIEIEYEESSCISQINQIFKDNNITIRNEKTEIFINDENKIYKKKIVVQTNHNISVTEVIESLACLNSIKRVQIVDD